MNSAGAKCEDLRSLTAIVDRVKASYPGMDCALLQRAIRTYGIDAQLLMAVEEAGELQHALLKYRRGAHAHEEGRHTVAGMDRLLYDVLEEMADVRIMMAQMELLFGSADEMVGRKMDRLRSRLEEG